MCGPTGRLLHSHSRLHTNALHEPGRLLRIHSRICIYHASVATGTKAPQLRAKSSKSCPCDACAMTHRYESCRAHGASRIEPQALVVPWFDLQVQLLKFEQLPGWLKTALNSRFVSVFGCAAGALEAREIAHRDRTFLVHAGGRVLHHQLL